MSIAESYVPAPNLPPDSTPQPSDQVVGITGGKVRLFNLAELPATGSGLPPDGDYGGVVVSLAGNFWQIATPPGGIKGPLEFTGNPGDPTGVPLTVKPQAGQTANSQEWYDLAAALVAFISKEGYADALRYYAGPASPAVYLHDRGGAGSGLTFARDGFGDFIEADYAYGLFFANTMGLLFGTGNYTIGGTDVGLARGSGAFLQATQGDGSLGGTRHVYASYFRLDQTTEPADAVLGNGQALAWLDPTPGAAALNWKAKDSAGTVVRGSVPLT